MAVGVAEHVWRLERFLKNVVGTGLGVTVAPSGLDAFVLLRGADAPRYELTAPWA